MPHSHHIASGSFGPALVSLALAFTGLLYLGAWVRLQSKPSTCTPPWRACSFLGGLFLIWLAVASPFASLDHELLTAHMLKHLLLMTIAPPLIWLGKPVRMLSHGLPLGRLLRAPGRGFQLRAAIMKMAGVLGRPEFCWCAATAALVAWHIPSIFALGMKSASWHFAEESSFLVAGLLFWWPVIQPGCAGPGTSGTADLSLVLYLFLATLPCDILSGFLVFCDRVVYPAYAHSSHMFGLSPLEDQQCAAALMWTLVTIVYLIAGALLMFRSFYQMSGPEPSAAQSALIGVAPEKVQQRLEAF